MSNINIWAGPNGEIIPANKKEVKDIVPYAGNLTLKQQEHIVAAFQSEAYDMAAEYAWRKAMVKLKESISTLGMDFIGELLHRNDLNEYTSIESVLTDFATIQLAEQLGVINKTAAIKLRHAQELITHYFSEQSEGAEIDALDAASIIKSSIQYILGEQNISVAIEFSQFRTRLLGENLKIDDLQVKQIIASPLFYLRTVYSILTSSIKNDKGATLEHALGNINLFLPHIWNNLSESDKWNIGETYKDVIAAGNSTAALGMKSVLMKVKGFDFVPESLRSSTFKTAARSLIEIHFSYNNFYNEPKAVKALANLGTIIPPPAFADCIQAYLLVYLGNMYGTSIEGASIAYKELINIGYDRWHYCFDKIIHTSTYILENIETSTQVKYFNKLLVDNNFNDYSDLPKDNQYLYNMIIKNEPLQVKAIASKMLDKIR